MEENINSSLACYEEDFKSFQQKLSKLRETNPNQFVAFRKGVVVSSGPTIEEVRENLNSKGIEPSGTVIEFVSKDEIKVIV